MSQSPNIQSVKSWLLFLQENIVSAVEAIDGKRFIRDAWERPEGGGGISRLIEEGNVLERGGVGFSHVMGASLPPSAAANRPEVAGSPWEAMGVSLVIHPKNPYVPTSHANVRFFCANPAADPSEIQNRESNIQNPIWWFGGGFDLTPYYGFEEDAVHWHRTARDAVAPFGEGLHARFKRACDEYFLLRHRGEPRGIGGLFFDDFSELGFERSFALLRAVGDAYLPAYRPIVARRKSHPWGERERQFQLYRRGRYVEFNLVFDRGTHFGLQSGGRTESILLSMPPLVSWSYQHQPEPGSAEARLYTDFLVPRDWA